MTRIGSTVRDWVRSAPITHLWLILLLATTIVQHTVSPARLERILGHRSTNLGNLSTEPVKALFASLFWLDGAYWVPYLFAFTVFVAVAERWLGARRFLLVGLGGHVLATLISQGGLYVAIRRDEADPALRSAVDVGVSYFLAAVIGVLAYRTTGWRRSLHLAGCALFFGAPMLDRPDFTAVGHLAALLIGLAAYPLTRSLPTVASFRDWFASPPTRGRPR